MEGHPPELIPVARQDVAEGRGRKGEIFSTGEIRYTAILIFPKNFQGAIFSILPPLGISLPEDHFLSDFFDLPWG